MFIGRKAKKLRKENLDLREQCKSQKGRLADLEAEVSAYEQKIECSTTHVAPLVRMIEKLCADFRYAGWDNHPAAMILIQQTRAYFDTIMFHKLEIPEFTGLKEKPDREVQNVSLVNPVPDRKTVESRRKAEAWQKVYGRNYTDIGEPPFPPMQADDFDSGKFVEFSSDEYKSMIIGVKASESKRIAIEPGIDAICTEPWGYERLTEDKRGLGRVMHDYWGKWDNMEYEFYWPFCLTTVGKAGNHSIAVACLYHESILACGETNMYADTYMDYGKSEIFHRVTSDGVYWFKDEEPYCMVSNRQKAVIWMILHTIMDAEYPIKYKGIQLNENE